MPSMGSTRPAARDESEYTGRRDRGLFDALGHPVKVALKALPPTVFTLLVAAIPGSMSIKARYEAETRHLVEVLAAHMQAVIANPPRNVSLEEALKSLVRQAKWNSDTGHANGYFFLYQGTKCLANGGFPECEGKDYCNFASPVFRKAIDDLVAAAPRNAEQKDKITIDYDWPQPGRPKKESAGKVGYSLSVAVPGNEGWWLGSAVYTGDLYASWLNSAKWLFFLLMPFFVLSHWYARRRHSRQMLNIVPEGIVITDARYEITFANQESLQIFGYTEAELIGLDVRELVPEAHRVHFKRELDEVDAGKKVVRWHAARVGKGGRPLRVHSMVVKMPERHLRMHVVVDTTKRHQFDLACAALEQDTQSKEWATLLCVRIHNFEGATNMMDPDAVPEVYNQYRSKVEEAVSKVHGLRVELPPPHLDWTRTVIACIFPDEGSGQQGSAGAEAALNVLDALQRWQRDSRIEMPATLAVQILVRRGYVALSNRRQRAPTVSGKDVARSLGLLDQCPFDRVTLSKDVYAASARCFERNSGDGQRFVGNEGSFLVKIGPLRLTGDDAERKSERFEGHEVELVEPSSAMSYKWDFFIAHSNADTQPAEELYACLNAAAKVFLDQKCLLLGDDWDRCLADAQRASLITVVLVSSRTERAYYEREEIAAAVEFARRNEHVHRVIPIYLDDVTNVPYGIRLKHAIRWSSELTMAKAATRLLHELPNIKAAAERAHEPSVYKTA